VTARLAGSYGTEKAAAATQARVQTVEESLNDP